MSVDHVPWLVHLMHDQFSLGGVSLLAENCSGDDAETPAMAGGEESATAKSVISWDYVAFAWVAAGRELKPEEVSPREAAALGWTKQRGIFSASPRRRSSLTSLCATGWKTTSGAGVVWWRGTCLHIHLRWRAVRCGAESPLGCRLWGCAGTKDNLM